jgi:hypothetical protein
VLVLSLRDRPQWQRRWRIDVDHESASSYGHQYLARPLRSAERKMHYAFIADVNVHGHGITVVIIIAVFLARKMKSGRRKSRDNGVFEMKRR